MELLLLLLYYLAVSCFYPEVDIVQLTRNYALLFIVVNLNVQQVDEEDRVLKRKARFGTVAAASVDVCLYLSCVYDVDVCIYILCGLVAVIFEV